MLSEIVVKLKELFRSNSRSACEGDTVSLEVQSVVRLRLRGNGDVCCYTSSHRASDSERLD